jgi:hypothetical protein
LLSGRGQTGVHRIRFNNRPMIVSDAGRGASESSKNSVRGAIGHHWIMRPGQIDASDRCVLFSHSRHGARGLLRERRSHCVQFASIPGDTYHVEALSRRVYRRPKMSHRPHSVVTELHLATADQMDHCRQDLVVALSYFTHRLDHIKKRQITRFSHGNGLRSTRVKIAKPQTTYHPVLSKKYAIVCLHACPSFEPPLRTCQPRG